LLLPADIALAVALVVALALAVAFVLALGEVFGAACTIIS
jgi:hypothetical protein